MDLIYEEQASTPPNGMNLIYNDQDFLTDADSSREAFLYSHDDSIEGENDYDEADESYISSSNIDTTINDPELLNVLNELSQEPSDHIISFQKFYYFNTCSYEVPHHGNHMQPALQNIALIVESWLTEQLLYAGDSIPILEESPQISAESVMTKLKMALNAFDDLSNVSIQIRAGHVYLLHMIDDEIVISPNHKQFIQDNQSMADEIKDQSSVLAQNKISYHYQLTNGITTIRRTVSSADGQIFYLLDEIPTTIYFMESDNARF
ncbi:44827_t:CDS:2 [Gigaspora margarita]|uniref:44827_t:CDS:1 n=1 Tax=Gigaspora margarita TaxID=4874 RepID=A0ABN7ULU4_GIGMA|nr:44827_t:CDS:2 [Gigaspora margarita]